ncbi:H-type lectin domain-containing protein [Thalassovita sp.]|uniref:H-type lectin domain-containing protein n=1 Tax=Thalassovita sp. TaxID=1979401 RepID=UPI0029DE7F72|nr:H-type lectin domain-containing protein [Thalassovita sp.]
MMILNDSPLGIAQGNTDLFEEFTDGGDMWTGDGTRTRRTHVTFDQPFTAPPAVHCSLSLFDIDQSTNMRGDISVDNITESGFVIVFSTWGNTRIARARANWLAIGQAKDPDRWDV